MEGTRSGEVERRLAARSERSLTSKGMHDPSREEERGQGRHALRPFEQQCRIQRRSCLEAWPSADWYLSSVENVSIPFTTFCDCSRRYRTGNDSRHKEDLVTMTRRRGDEALLCRAGAVGFRPGSWNDGAVVWEISLQRNPDGQRCRRNRSEDGAKAQAAAEFCCGNEIFTMPGCPGPPVPMRSRP